MTAEQAPPVRDEFRPVALRIAETPHAGRGVFALEPIASGSLIEECPILELSQDELQVLMPTMLGNYFFQWGPAREEGALALGYGSLFNHSFSPNATYIRKLHTKTLMFVSVRDIAVGEEITVNYNGYPDDKDPVWF